MLQHMNGDWVLCDFGSATDKTAVYESSNAVMMGEEVIRKYTTPAYRAPEVSSQPVQGTTHLLHFCCNRVRHKQILSPCTQPIFSLVSGCKADGFCVLRSRLWLWD